ncbi:MAG: hypothetical protein Q7R91_02170 [bacterium]|nr:hypothetical protein [bacterium]
MNEWQYSHARSEFFRVLYELLPGHVPNLHYVKDRYFEIDLELFKEWGVRRGRVAEAMALFYREVCTWAKWRFGKNYYRQEHEMLVRAIGDLPFDYTKLEWLPEARAVLQHLKAGGHRLCLLSCYDTALFHRRATHMNIFEFFPQERVQATEQKKTADDFCRVSGYTSDSSRFEWWFAIGNGDNDILPALSLGKEWSGIYVPHGSSSPLFNPHDRGEGFQSQPLEHPRIQTLRSLEDLIPFVS